LVRIRRVRGHSSAPTRAAETGLQRFSAGRRGLQGWAGKLPLERSADVERSGM
jgi:hypothetical protein